MSSGGLGMSSSSDVSPPLSELPAPSFSPRIEEERSKASSSSFGSLEWAAIGCGRGGLALRRISSKSSKSLESECGRHCALVLGSWCGG